MLLQFCRNRRTLDGGLLHGKLLWMLLQNSELSILPLLNFHLEKELMKLAIPILTVGALIALSSWGQAQTITTLTQVGSTTFFGNGSTVAADGTVVTTGGGTGNTLGIFDGDAFSGNPDEGFFDTAIFGRSRSNQGQTNNIADPFVDFDLTGFQGPVNSAFLNFTAYSLNGESPFSVGRVTDAAPSANPTVVDAVTGNSFTPRTVEETIGDETIGDVGSTNAVVQDFSIDLTDLINNAIGVGDTSLQLLIGLEDNVNDGIGIFDGVATSQNNGTVNGAFTAEPITATPIGLVIDAPSVAVPEPGSALLIGLGGVFMAFKRRRK